MGESSADITGGPGNQYGWFGHSPDVIAIHAERHALDCTDGWRPSDIDFLTGQQNGLVVQPD